MVRPYRTFSVYIVTGETRCAGCLCTSSGWFKHIEPHRIFSNHIITEIARCVEFCHMSSGGSTVPNLLYLHRYRGNKVCRVLCTCSVWFKHIEPRSSNLLEPHHYKDSKVCRVLSHEFGVVRLYRTFSIYIVTKIARCAGWLCTSSRWFKHIEPHRIFSNHIITEIARCVEFCHMSSGWFDCTEPSLSTSLQGQQGMQGVVHLFGVVQAHRTFPNHIITEIAKCVEFCHMSSGWFDLTEPSLSSSLQWKQSA